MSHYAYSPEIDIEHCALLLCIVSRTHCRTFCTVQGSSSEARTIVAAINKERSVQRSTALRNASGSSFISRSPRLVVLAFDFAFCVTDCSAWLAEFFGFMPQNVCVRS